MSDPDWYTKAKAEGRILSEVSVSPKELSTLTDPQVVCKSMTEAEFTARVIALARECGWLTAHFRTARITRKDGSVYYETAVQGDGAGFPDLVLVRTGRTLYVELKSDKGALKEAQKLWRAALTVAGQEWRLWRPRDWDQIVKELQ